MAAAGVGWRQSKVPLLSVGMRRTMVVRRSLTVGEPSSVTLPRQSPETLCRLKTISNFAVLVSNLYQSVGFTVFSKQWLIRERKERSGRHPPFILTGYVLKQVNILYINSLFLHKLKKNFLERSQTAPYSKILNQLLFQSTNVKQHIRSFLVVDAQYKIHTFRLLIWQNWANVYRRWHRPHKTS